MAIFPNLRLIQYLRLTGLVSLGLILAAPGFANPRQAGSDRFTATALMPSVLKQSEIFVAQSQQDIIDTATADGSFQTLLQLLNELGMTEDLRGYGRFTVFAPTDAAFAAVPPEMMEKLSADRALMAKVLAYHVVSSTSPLVSNQIHPPVSVRTLERSEIRITKRRGNLYVNNAKVIDADIQASNGVIHAIDQVLIPEDLMAEIRR